MNYFDYVCIGICILHVLVSLVQSLRFKKRVTKICDECLSPVVDGEEHVCDLNGQQLKALTLFILSLKGENK